jgi:hypothetical protein
MHGSAFRFFRPSMRIGEGDRASNFLAWRGL